MPHIFRDLFYYVGLGVFFLWLFIVLSSPARAIDCENRDELLRVVAQNFDEYVVGQGIDKHGQLATITSSRDRGWTLLVTPPDRTDIACIVFSVTSYQWEQTEDGGGSGVVYSKPSGTLKAVVVVQPNGDWAFQRVVNGLVEREVTGHGWETFNPPELQPGRGT